MVDNNDLELSEIILSDNEHANININYNSNNKIIYENKKLNRKQIIILFNEYIHTCVIKRKLHLYTARYYSKINTFITVIIFIFGSLTTGIASLNVITSESGKSLSIAILTAVLTIFTQINDRLKYNIKSNEHLNSANLYSNLARKIEIQLFQSNNEHINKCFEIFHKEFNNIEITEPLIPQFVEKKIIK
jgi:hypothetical protein